MASAGQAPNRASVLIVDDTGANLVALSAVLSPLGVRIVEASSGPEALARVREESFAVVLLDVQMPGMDGFAIAERMRELPNGKELPLIFVTAIHRDEAFMRKGYAIGAADYVTKPFDIQVLRARVRAFVELFQQREEVRRIQVAARTNERDEALRRVATFERIASAALESNDLKLLLDELLQIFLDGADSANFASIALGKGGDMHVVSNAVRGVPTRVAVSSKVGSLELCEEVARRREPVLLGLNSLESRERRQETTSHAAPRSGSHELLGVPLVHGDELLGVAYAGSSEDDPLSERERALFGTVAERAAWAVAKHAERSRLQAERNDLLRREQMARHQAELASRAKDEFLATLSHELRTPLNAVLGWTARARSKAPPELQRPLEIVARNAEAQARMVDDMLDLSRIINGKLRLELHLLAVKDPINGALEAVRPSAETKGVELNSEIDEQLRVHGDPDRIQQIVWNLLTNAIKFTPKGGRVRLTTTREHGKVRISVKDTGQGIAEDFLPNVFTPFQQEDGTSTRRHGGLGLGLTIARQLAEAHAGKLLASSPGVDQGSTFTLELPAVLEDVRKAEATAESVVEDEEEPRLEHVRILVVDDENDSRCLVSELLADTGAEVRTAESVSEALKEVRRFRPNVLISDIAMPEADGYQLIRQVRALPANQGGATRAIALTAYARGEDVNRALKAGFQRHLPKPVDLQRLKTIVSRLAHE
ncbi:MAG: response regulator [Myxococcales bacterium]